MAARATRSSSNVTKENVTQIMLPAKKFWADKSSQPLMTAAAGKKRKATDEVERQGLGKRAALGEITNKTTAAASNNSSTLSKGGHFIAGLLRKSLRRGKKIEKSEEQKDNNKVDNESYGESESSTEIIGCGLQSPDSSATSTSSADLVLSLPTPDFTIVSPVRPPVPQGVEDFDLLTKEDPNEIAEYARDIFQYYKSRESAFTVVDYIRAQADLTPVMRAILVDWMVEVQESFEFNHETLYSAVKIVDIYLSKKKVAKDNLQLIGAAALLLASKVEELMPPLVSDFVYVCDDAYTRDTILAMERKMLKVVGFDIGFPLSYRFVRRYAKVCKVGVSDLTFARYILETSLLHYDLNINTSPSVLAAAALTLVLKIKGISGWEQTLEHYSGYALTDLVPTVQQLHAMLLSPLPDQVQTVRSKYSHKVFHKVATIPIPPTIQF